LSWVPALGSMKMSLWAAALPVTVAVASSIVHAAPDDGERVKGSPGTSQAMVCRSL